MGHIRFWFRAAAVAWGSAIVCAVVAPAAERMVLGEMFGSDGCPHCSANAPRLGDLFDAYYDPNTGESEFQFIYYHLSDGLQTSFGNSRWSFYTTGAVPTVSMNGESGVVGERSYEWYEGHFLMKRQQYTDVTMTMAANHLSGLDYRATVCVSMEVTGAAKPLKLFMAYIEDYYPDTQPKHRNTCRGGAEVTTFVLTPGTSQVFTYDFDLTMSDGNLNNVRLIAWVQKTDSSPPADVPATRMITYPFPEDCNENGVPDDLDIADCDGSAWCDDCNGNQIPDECDIASGYAQDDNGNGIPDDCEPCCGDANCDDQIDFGDINAFVHAMLCLGEPDPEACWSALYPDCPYERADVNESGSPDFGDINPFVDVLLTCSLPVACPYP